MNQKQLLDNHRKNWNMIADDWFGATSLPRYGCYIPTEDDLKLFPDLTGKTVLDIGCGSGHSLKWCAEHGARELYGVDLSDRQLENAQKLLTENGYFPKLFRSPMEEDCGIPKNFFDIVYSIYAIGWTTDLQHTFDLIGSYIKQGGTFLFSWDHPLMHCVDFKEQELVFSGSYDEKEPFTFTFKGGCEVSLTNRRYCDYINALSNAGFAVVKLIEETDSQTLAQEAEFTSKYYSPFKAKKFPLSFVIKAIKL